MNEFTLRFTSAADNDLDAIYEYIANTCHSPEAALRLVERIESAIKRLKSYPYAASKVTDTNLIDKEYRKLIINKHYVVIYRVDQENKIVRIIRVFHSAANYILSL